MVRYCPDCLRKGKKAELFDSANMLRCTRCEKDYRLQIKEGKVAEPVRGLKAILGGRI
jgi:hypothetical protein